MTAAERIRREGHKEGYREGLITMLEARFGALPAAVLAAIHAAEKPTLDRWYRQSITARTLEDIFGDEA